MPAKDWKRLKPKYEGLWKDLFGFSCKNKPRTHSMFSPGQNGSDPNEDTFLSYSGDKLDRIGVFLSARKVSVQVWERTEMDPPSCPCCRFSGRFLRPDQQIHDFYLTPGYPVYRLCANAYDCLFSYRDWILVACKSSNKRHIICIPYINVVFFATTRLEIEKQNTSNSV